MLQGNPITDQEVLRQYRLSTDHLVRYLGGQYFAKQQNQKRKKPNPALALPRTTVISRSAGSSPRKRGVSEKRKAQPASLPKPIRSKSHSRPTSPRGKRRRSLNKPLSRNSKGHSKTSSPERKNSRAESPIEMNRRGRSKTSNPSSPRRETTAAMRSSSPLAVPPIPATRKPVVVDTIKISSEVQSLRTSCHDDACHLRDRIGKLQLRLKREKDDVTKLVRYAKIVKKVKDELANSSQYIIPVKRVKAPNIGKDSKVIQIKKTALASLKQSTLICDSMKETAILNTDPNVLKKLHDILVGALAAFPEKKK